MPPLTANSEDELRVAYRAHVANSMPAFALCALATVAVAMLVLHLDERANLTPILVLLGLQGGLLAAIVQLCRSRPESRLVPLVAGSTCALIAAVLTGFYAHANGDGALLAFMLMILVTASALLFAWDRKSALLLMLAVLTPWIIVRDQLKYLGGPSELPGALLVGSLIYLAIAEHAARTLRTALRNRIAERDTVRELESSRNAYRDLTERYDHALMAASVGTWNWHIGQDAITWDDSLCRLFDRDPGFVPRGVEEYLNLLHPDDRDRERQIVSAALKEGTDYRSEYRLLRPDGSVRVLASRGAFRRNANGVVELLTGVCWDVTERRAADDALRASLEELRRSEERLRRLGQRQTAVREEERKRLGFDLHDNVCQELVGIAILIESGRQRMRVVPPGTSSDFERAVRYLHELAEHLRLLAHDLRPMPLYDLGLDGSLESLARGMTSVTTRVIADVRKPMPRLDELTEVAVYRVAQEALTNALRHAGATTVRLVLRVDDGALLLEVADDGRGFAVDERRSGASFGLVGMEERALGIGGRLEVSSAPDAGTTVQLVCPISVEAAAGGTNG